MNLKPTQRVIYTERRRIDGESCVIMEIGEMDYNGKWDHLEYLVQWKGLEIPLYGYPTDREIIDKYKDILQKI